MQPHPSEFANTAPPPRQRKTSPWVYVGCGCALLLVLAALGGLFVFKKFFDEGRKMRQGLTDPKVREQRTRELLSYGELPAGYYPAGALSLPFVFDMAFLGDQPPAAGAVGPGGDHGAQIQDRGFIFMKLHLGKLPDDDQARRRMLFRTKGKAPWEQGSGLRIETEEPLGDGEVTAGGAHVLFRTTRGEVQMNNRRHQGITSILLIACPDRRIRFGIWLVPDPAPGQPAATLDKSGTPADSRTVTGFLDHFNLCTGG